MALLRHSSHGRSIWPALAAIAFAPSCSFRNVTSPRAINSIAGKIGCTGETLRSWVRQAERTCTVARLMRRMGLQGVVRGRKVRTTVSDPPTPCPLDRVNRQFHAPRPNALWLSDFTDVATWQGFVYVAFIIGAYARRIVGWSVSRTAHAAFVLDALEQALADRRPVQGGGLVHHSDRGREGGFKWSSQHSGGMLDGRSTSVGSCVAEQAAFPGQPPMNSSATCRLNATLCERCRAMTSILRKPRQRGQSISPIRPPAGAHSIPWKLFNAD